ncbi:MAG: SpoIVB peptidase S55 domain-containing protein [Thermoanaerobaculia bacterium]|nr:SpoIVB peptidase S55 domain-containing protein [Thermoanaerobaculia bacterium]
MPPRCRSLAASAILALALAAPAGAQEIIPLEEVRPGQRGTGLSVFAGSTPERFELEVLGVWRNVQPDTSYILARLEGRGLERTGVIAGMSGSPVYLDGRLAGAVAFAWPFAQEPIAGITPIEAMRGLGAVRSPSVPGGQTVWSGRLQRLVAGELDRGALEEALARLAPSPVGGSRSGLQWVTSGFGPATRSLLAGALGSVAPAGAAGPGAAASELEPGSAVAAVLVDGDLRLAATGTVTDRTGDRILAFGHPFLGLGSVRFPMAVAEVITVVSSRFNSFKVANMGPVVGAFDFDQLVGIRGSVGAVAPTIPMQVTVRGESERRMEMRVAEIPLVSPSMAAVALLGAIEGNADSSGSEGIDLAVRFHLDDGEVLETRQSFDGVGSPIQAALHLFAYTGFLLQNSLAEVSLEAIEVEVERSVEPRLARLVGAHATRTLLQPGDRLDLLLTLAAHRGEEFQRTLALELPTDLPEGGYSLLVGDGTSADAARLAIERAEPVSFRQALELLRSLHSRREVVVLGVFEGAGLAVAGEVLPQLPASIRSLWGAAASGSAVPLRLALAQQEELERVVPVQGLVRIDLQGERRAPLPGPDGEPAAGPPTPAGGEAG